MADASMTYQQYLGTLSTEQVAEEADAIVARIAVGKATAMDGVFVAYLASVHAKVQNLSEDVDALQSVAERALAPSPPPPNTVPVRIAVAVTAKGEWAADGGSRYKDKDSEAKCTAQECIDFEESRITFVTAHCPLPDPPGEVAGTVERGEGRSE